MPDSGLSVACGSIERVIEGDETSSLREKSERESCFVSFYYPLHATACYRKTGIWHHCHRYLYQREA